LARANATRIRRPFSAKNVYESAGADTTRKLRGEYFFYNGGAMIARRLGAKNIVLVEFVRPKVRSSSRAIDMAPLSFKQFGENI